MGFLFAHHKKFRGFSEMEVGWVFLQKLIFVDFLVVIGRNGVRIY